jgi:formylglycine-generating enzyme required for sulfatase activity
MDNTSAGINTGLEWQCVEYVNRYYYTICGMNIRIPGQNANQYYPNAASRGLVSFPNGGTTAPQVGDILCFSETGSGLGHVAIIRAVDQANTPVHVIQQNVKNGGSSPNGYGTDADWMFAYNISGGTYTVDVILANVGGSRLGPDFYCQGWLRKPATGNQPSGMVLIPAGSFTMGNCMDPTEGDSGELPLHTVYVSAFYMDKYDVTKALWDQVYQWAINHGYNFDYPGSGKAANHPVGTNDWYDAVKWCNARSELEGRVPAYYTSATQTTVFRTGQVDVQNDCVKWNAGYRLPTEAEWEKAARGGLSGQRFPWGDTISWSQANYYFFRPSYAYDATNPPSGFDPAFNDGVQPSTSPVGYFAPNGYGLFDMAGNVWQWCWDWYDSDYYATSSGTDPRGPTCPTPPTDGSRVFRGGCWVNDASCCRTAGRGQIAPSFGNNRGYIGFRSLLSPGQDNPPAQTLSATTVKALPNSMLADGKSFVMVTVTVLDDNGQPVPGKTIKVSALGTTTGVAITQAANPTDANGQATATLTSTTPGTVLIAATDVTDGLAFSRQSQQPTVTFTANLVKPSTEFSSTIGSARDGVAGLLAPGNNGIAQIAIDEGNIGASFKQKVSSEAAQTCVDVLFFAGSEAADAVVTESSALQKLAVSAGETVDNDLVGGAMQTFIEGLAGDASGLIKVGEGIAADCSQKSAALTAQAQALRSGIPAASADRAEDWMNALALRTQANQVLWQVLQCQDATLNQMLTAAEAGDGGVGAVIGYGSAVVAVFLPPPADLAVGLAALDYSILQHYQAQKEAIQGYQTAWSSLTACSQYAASIYWNLNSALQEIAQGVAPDSVTGTVLEVRNTGLWALQQSSLSNPAWGNTAESTPAYLVTASSTSTLVDVQNTGQESATFEAFAFYHPAATTLNASAGAQIVVSAVKDLGPGEQGQLNLVYYDGHNGAVPDATQPIQISVLGWNSTGDFYIGSGASTIQFTLTPQGTRGPTGRHGVAPMDGPNPTNALVIQNPIQSFIAPNPTNQSYDALIAVRNPFLLPLLATVNQAIPTGVTVLETDGMAGGAGITWTNLIPSNGLAVVSFSFNLATTPGAVTNLPSPTVVFSEPGTTNSLGLDSIAPNFNGLFPVQVAGFVPLGTPGTNADMRVTVTNLTALAQTGTLTLTLTNTTLALGTNLAQPFTVAAAGSTNLDFSLPGGVPAGQYAVTGLLSMNGGNGQVLAGVYTMPALPFWLSPGPAPLWSTNGLSLSLQGPVGSNYLIQVSTDLVTWTPLRYFGITNSPFYFNDATATNASVQFYRAVIP